jgi:hypothetical protein
MTAHHSQPPESPKDSPTVFEQNIRRLLTMSYEPERPSEQFVEHAMHRMLRTARTAADRREGRFSWIRNRSFAFQAAAAILLIAMLSAGAYVAVDAVRHPGAAGHDGIAHAVGESEAAVASLASTVDAVWSAPLPARARLSAGKLQLKEGVAQLVFAKGAVVSLEAPVELELVNDGLCRLLSGAVAANVPPDAVGFTVLTPEMRIVDLGTAFGVRIGSDAATEIHVFEGEIDLFEAVDGATANRLRKGDAVRKGMHLHPVSIPSNPKSFVKDDDVARRLERRRELARQRWVDYSKRWANDEAVVLRYDFSAVDGNVIRNTAAPAKHPAQAVNSTPRLIEGRWPGKHAMVFDGRTDMLTVADHADLRLDGDFTLAAWLRLGGDVYGGWTRIAGKGVGTLRNYGLWTPANSRLVWQVCPQGEFQWWDTEVTTRELERGVWHLIAGVVADDMCKIYVDGKLELARAIDRPVATSNDPLTIGHYGEIPAHEGYFSGEMDEFLLLDRALSAREIADMHAAGKPE